MYNLNLREFVRRQTGRRPRCQGSSPSTTRCHETSSRGPRAITVSLPLALRQLFFQNDDLREVDHRFPTIRGFQHARHQVARFKTTNPEDQTLSVPVKRFAAHQGVKSVVILLILFTGEPAVRAPG